MGNPEDDELLEVVNDLGTVLALARRTEVHGNPSLLHRVVHVLVFNGKGELLLQKRSLSKAIEPGKWDTSVGGHVDPGESIIEAAMREMAEELGAGPRLPIEFLYQYRFMNHIESELVHTFRCTYEGPFAFNRAEVDEVRFWGTGEISSRLSEEIFSPYFREEFRGYMAWAARQTPRSSGP